MKPILERAWKIQLCLLIGVVWPSFRACASEDAISCVKTMTMPGAYSGLMTRIPATVEAHIEIGDDGAATTVT